MLYRLFMDVFGLMLLALAAPSSSFSEGRSLPACATTESLKIDFNQEKLSAFCLVIDARSEGEQQADREAGSLKGPAIVFFQGHAQRPSDAYVFTSGLALHSRSGIVVIPVCDTPYGEDTAWRGDRGKDVILMEIVRWMLAARGITVEGYSPLPHDPVRINDNYTDDGKCRVRSGLIAVGWSHGGILARRFAHAYPASVSALGQVCPAGYEHMSPLKLTGRFALESLRISKLTASGHASDTLRSAWGFTKGFVGDFARSLPNAVLYAQPEKIFRTSRDIKDCTLYSDSSLFSLGHLKAISVIFGAEDSCMSPGRILGTAEPGIPPQEKASAFWEKYYADVSPDRTNLSLAILPGTHLAPVSHSDLYVPKLLENLDRSEGS